MTDVSWHLAASKKLKTLDRPKVMDTHDNLYVEHAMESQGAASIPGRLCSWHPCIRQCATGTVEVMGRLPWQTTPPFGALRLAQEHRRVQNAAGFAPTLGFHQYACKSSTGGLMDPPELKVKCLRSFMQYFHCYALEDLADWASGDEGEIIHTARHCVGEFIHRHGIGLTSHIFECRITQ